MVFFGVSCVIINFWVSFLSSDFKAIIQFTCWFLLTHPGQRRRHSGDSSYRRRPRDGGRQNKEQQEVHAPTRTGLHIYLTYREFLFIRFCFVWYFVSWCLVVKFWFWLLLLLLWVCSHLESTPLLLVVLVLVGRRGRGEDPPCEWWVFSFGGGVTFI